MLLEGVATTANMIRKSNKTKWVLLALLAAFIGAPNATIIKFNLSETDPMFYNVLRYSIVVAACALLMLGKYNKMHRQGVRHALVSGMAMALAVTFYVLALDASQASYVAILTLITPVFFVIISSITLREKIKHTAIAGMTLAMLGAMLVVAGPIALLQGSDFTVYPLATFYMFINSITFSVALVWMRRANEAKLPIMGVVGIQSIVVLLVVFGLMLAFGDWDRTEVTPTLLASVLYSGIGLAIIVRSLNTLVYERLGSAIVGGMGYIETFLAILLPVFILGEQLSLTMVIGGILILYGVYIIERRKVTHKHHHHWLHMHRHH